MKKDNVLLSVVVTIYNTAPYLKKCIESILKQTYTNLEILLIDDGSTDGSDKICDEYAGKDHRIKVCHKNNEGLVIARKTGVMLAEGGVITFVDSDDWIECEMYEKLIDVYCRDEYPDMISSGIIFDCENKSDTLSDSIKEGTYEKADIQNDILPRMACDARSARPGITASVCNKIFKINTFKKITGLIDNKLVLGEDGAFVYSFLAYASKIVSIQAAWYHYIQHKGSMIRRFDFHSFEKIYLLQKCLLDVYKSAGLLEAVRSQINYYVQGFLHAVVRNIYAIDFDTITYMFPYELVPRGSRIILYGAGQVGQSYRKCLTNGRYAFVTGWVDKNYINIRKTGLQAEPADIVTEREFDYVVIAVEKAEIAEEIKQELLKYGVCKEKIIWKKGMLVMN